MIYRSICRLLSSFRFIKSECNRLIHRVRNSDEEYSICHLRVAGDIPSYLLRHSNGFDSVEVDSNIHIGKASFEHSGVRKLHVHKGAVMSHYAFGHCAQLKEILIENNVLVKSYAFVSSFNDQIRKLHIKSGAVISEDAFSGGQRFSEVIIEDDVEIKPFAFCRARIDKLVIGDHCRVGKYAFFKVRRMSVPDTNLEIGNYTTIGESSFEESRWKFISLGHGVFVDKCAFKGAGIHHLLIKDDCHIESEAFSGQRWSMESVIIGDRPTLCHAAFENTSVLSVSMGEHAEIGSRSFAMAKIEKLTMAGRGVLSYDVFYGSSIDRLILNSDAKLDPNSFRGCTRLAYLDLGHDQTFDFSLVRFISMVIVESLQVVSIGNNVTLHREGLHNQEQFKKFHLGNNVRLGFCSFYGSHVEHIEMGDHASIHANAFNSTCEDFSLVMGRHGEIQTSAFHKSSIRHLSAGSDCILSAMSLCDLENIETVRLGKKSFLGWRALSGSSIQQVFLGNGARIDEYAMADTKHLLECLVGSNSVVQKHAFFKSGIVSFHAGKVDLAESFTQCERLKDVVVGDQSHVNFHFQVLNHPVSLYVMDGVSILFPYVSSENSMLSVFYSSNPLPHLQNQYYLEDINQQNYRTVTSEPDEIRRSVQYSFFARKFSGVYRWVDEYAHRFLSYMSADFVCKMIASTSCSQVSMLSRFSSYDFMSYLPKGEYGGYTTIWLHLIPYLTVLDAFKFVLSSIRLDPDAENIYLRRRHAKSSSVLFSFKNSKMSLLAHEIKCSLSRVKALEARVMMAKV